MDAEIHEICCLCKEIFAAVKSLGAQVVPAGVLVPDVPNQPSTSQATCETAPIADPLVAGSSAEEIALRTSQAYGVVILGAVSGSLKDIQRDVVTTADRIEWASGEVARARLHKDYRDR